MEKCITYLVTSVHEYVINCIDTHSLKALINPLINFISLLCTVFHPFRPRHMTYIIVIATECNVIACNSTQTVLSTAVSGGLSHEKGEKKT